MAKKKSVKKPAKKTKMKSGANCEPSEGSCSCKGILALAIIILTWWKPAELWAQIVMTVAAAIILLSGSSCCCKK